MHSRWSLAALLLVATCSGLVNAAAPDPEALRLGSELTALDNDPALAAVAQLERYKARQAVAALQVARSREREHALILAKAWTEAAQDAAQSELLREQSAQLDRERDQIMVAASRRDAELARREADRLRLQSLAREEEAQRLAQSMQQERLVYEQSEASAEVATAQASQAMKLAAARARETQLARKEAELAAAIAADSMEDSAAAPSSRRSGNKTIYTLPGSAFSSGNTQLTGAAQASLRRLATMLAGKRAVRIEAHTDSQGSDAANLQLSQKRADAVKKALLTGGVAAGKLQAIGKGEADPLVDNGAAEGRARNRRVEIIVE